MATATLPTPVITHAPTRPLDVQPHLQQVQRGHVTICSIYPKAHFKALMHNGMTHYSIQAAPRGSYALCVVYDTQTPVPRPSESKNESRWTFEAIPARIVADNLVSDWASDTLGARSGFRPGIAVIAGDTPTTEELAALRSTQNALFNWFITSAMGLHLKGKGEEITDIHRLAAKEMLDKGAERLPWFPVVDFAAVKDCPACGRQINANALRCDGCTTMLPQFYMEFDLVPENDQVVADFIKRIRAQKAAGKATELDPEKPAAIIEPAPKPGKVPFYQAPK